MIIVSYLSVQQTGGGLDYLLTFLVQAFVRTLGNGQERDILFKGKEHFAQSSAKITIVGADH